MNGPYSISNFFILLSLRHSLLPQNCSCTYQRVDSQCNAFEPCVAIIIAGFFKNDCSYRNDCGIWLHDDMPYKNTQPYMSHLKAKIKRLVFQKNSKKWGQRFVLCVIWICVFSYFSSKNTKSNHFQDNVEKILIWEILKWNHLFLYLIYVKGAVWYCIYC